MYHRTFCFFLWSFTGYCSNCCNRSRRVQVRPEKSLLFQNNDILYDFRIYKQLCSFLFKFSFVYLTDHWSSGFLVLLFENISWKASLVSGQKNLTFHSIGQPQNWTSFEEGAIRIIHWRVHQWKTTQQASSC